MKRTWICAAAAVAAIAISGCGSEESSASPTSSVASATERPGLPTSFRTDSGVQRIAGITFATGTYRPAGTSCTYVVRDRFDGDVVTGANVEGIVDVQLTKLGTALEGVSRCGLWVRQGY